MFVGGWHVILHVCQLCIKSPSLRLMLVGVGQPVLSRCQGKWNLDIIGWSWTIQILAHYSKVNVVTFTKFHVFDGMEWEPEFILNFYWALIITIRMSQVSLSSICIATTISLGFSLYQAIGILKSLSWHLSLGSSHMRAWAVIVWPVISLAILDW